MGAILKPLGVTAPTRRLMPRDWTVGVDLDRYGVITGPADRRRAPDVTKPTTVVLHGVGYARIFAIGEMLDFPHWDDAHAYAERWPWVIPIRVDLWVPDIEDGPRTGGLVSRAVLGRIQRGGDFSKLDPEELARVRSALTACPSVIAR